MAWKITEVPDKPEGSGCGKIILGIIALIIALIIMAAGA